MASIRNILKWTAFGFALVGIFLRFSIKDANPIAAAAFYALPLPVCSAGFAIAALLAFFSGKQRQMWTGIAATTLAGTVWLSLSWRQNSIPSSGGDLRVAFWNGSDNPKIFTHAAKMLDDGAVDILALAEVDSATQTDEAEFRRNHPEFQVLRPGGEMVVAVRGKAQLERSYRLPNRTVVHVFQTEVGNRGIRLVFADVGPNPYYPRREIMSRILEIAGDEPDTIVLGDFNTPYESVWFRDYHQRFIHAFSSAGTGVRETWPWPLPALSLDHIWLGTGFQAVRVEKRRSWASDHAMIVAEIR